MSSRPHKGCCKNNSKKWKNYDLEIRSILPWQKVFFSSLFAIILKFNLIILSSSTSSVCWMPMLDSFHCNFIDWWMSVHVKKSVFLHNIKIIAVLFLSQALSFLSINCIRVLYLINRFSGWFLFINQQKWRLKYTSNSIKHFFSLKCKSFFSLYLKSVESLH